jgi:hypothetical protein
MRRRRPAGRGGSLCQSSQMTLSYWPITPGCEKSSLQSMGARRTFAGVEALTPALLRPGWRISRSCGAPEVRDTAIEFVITHPFGEPGPCSLRERSSIARPIHGSRRAFSDEAGASIGQGVIGRSPVAEEIQAMKGNQSGSHAAPFRRFVISGQSLELFKSADARKFTVFLAHEHSLGQFPVHSDRLTNEFKTLQVDVRRKRRNALLRVGEKSFLSNNGPGNVHKLHGFQPTHCLGNGAHFCSLHERYRLASMSICEFPCWVN